MRLWSMIARNCKWQLTTASPRRHLAPSLTYSWGPPFLLLTPASPTLPHKSAIAVSSSSSCSRLFSSPELRACGNFHGILPPFTPSGINGIGIIWQHLLYLKPCQRLPPKWIESNQLLVESISDLKMFIYNKEFQLYPQSLTKFWRLWGGEHERKLSKTMLECCPLDVQLYRSKIARIYSWIASFPLVRWVRLELDFLSRVRFPDNFLVAEAFHGSFAALSGSIFLGW